MKNINLGSSPERPDNFTRNDTDNNGPGQYNHEKSFGQDGKSHKIGEKRPERQQEGMGPGAYDPDRADGQIKPKMKNINLGSSPVRPDNFTRNDADNNGPGQYNHERSFGQDVKSYKIGEKRPERQQEGMGPGAYDPDRADRQTKPKMKNINLSSSPERPDNFTRND